MADRNLFSAFLRRWFDACTNPITSRHGRFVTARGENDGCSGRGGNGGVKTGRPTEPRDVAGSAFSVIGGNAEGGRSSPLPPRASEPFSVPRRSVRCSRNRRQTSIRRHLGAIHLVSGLVFASAILAGDEMASTAVDLTVSVESVNEGAGATVVTVTGTLNGASIQGATYVNLETGRTGDTATEGRDYGPIGLQVLTIHPNAASGTLDFTLTPADDEDAEGDEVLTVFGVETAGNLDVRSATVTIVDNDTASVRAAAPAAEISLCAARLDAAEPVWRQAELDICWEVGNSFGTGSNTVIEWQQHFFWGENVANPWTPWKELARGDTYTPCRNSASCVQHTQEGLFRGSPFTYRMLLAAVYIRALMANKGVAGTTRCRAGRQDAASRQASSRLLRCAPALRVTRPNVLTHRVFMAGSELPATSRPICENTSSPEVNPHILCSPFIRGFSQPPTDAHPHRRRHGFRVAEAGGAGAQQRCNRAGTGNIGGVPPRHRGIRRGPHWGILVRPGFQ